MIGHFGRNAGRRMTKFGEPPLRPSQGGWRGASTFQRPCYLRHSTGGIGDADGFCLFGRFAANKSYPHYHLITH
jgi:hypothetical protein